MFPDFKYAMHFEWPECLLLLLLVIPTVIIALRSFSGLSVWQSTSALALRVLVIILLAISLARPVWQEQAEHLTTTVIADRSLSVPLTLKSDAIRMLSGAADMKTDRGDRLGVITVGRSASVAAIPDEATSMTVGSDMDDPTATNLANGVRTALAAAPSDTANRFILVSDGNENIDFVLQESLLARANGVPIDVLPLEYTPEREVVFDRLIAPAQARLGQTVALNAVLRSMQATSGRLDLSLNGEVADLNGPLEGTALHVDLVPGPNPIQLSLMLDTPGRQRFDAVFEPDDLTDDMIRPNNVGTAVTFVVADGRVLVLDDSGIESEQLQRALQEGEIAVEAMPPAGWNGLDFLAGYDAVVLANVPRWNLSDQQVRDLHTYVHDLGGGLIMLGGDQSFGAGGWIGSKLADALPVELEPKQTRQIMRGALAIIIDCSGSMSQPVAGTRMSQQQIANESSAAGILALSRLDDVTVIGFSGSAWVEVPLTPRGTGEGIVERVRTMGGGGGTNLFPALDLAADQLSQSSAGVKHIIILTDGQTTGDPNAGIARAAQLASHGITISTVTIGDLADDGLLQRLAAAGHGRRYVVQSQGSQAVLPQILIKEAQFISRSLIQDDRTYVTTAVPMTGPTAGFATSPDVDGYVLTASRGGTAQTPITVKNTEGDDPLYAFWNYGLGKSVAFTSDATGRWGRHWLAWSDYRAFWEQSVRWVMRPSAPPNVVVQTRLNGETAIVDIEVTGVGGSSAPSFVTAQATMVDPNSKVESLPLSQVGPGRFQGSFNATAHGAYLVNAAVANGAGEHADRGYVQAAVCVPYPREYAALQHNSALLYDIARKTGGRILKLHDPQLPDLFARESIDFPYSSREFWDLLVILAASFFVLDIASRRIVFSGAAALGIVGRMIRPTERRESAAVAAWKTQRSSVQQMRSPVDRKTQADAIQSQSWSHKQQDDSSTLPVTPTLQSDDIAPRRAPTQPHADDGGKVEPPLEKEESMSRLRAAKRRAKDKQDGTNQE